jgi:ATP-dependent DNA helicase RecG
MQGGAVGHALAAPITRRGELLAALAEDQWYDRKSVKISPRGLAESLVAFANADGGTVVIGIHDGMVEGVDARPDHLNALRQAAVDFTTPPVPTHARLYNCTRTGGGRDHLLVVDVPSGRTVHTTTRDEAFLRIGDENHKLTFAQRRDLLYDKGQSTYEAEPTTTPTADVDRPLLDSYLHAVDAPDGERLLTARGLAAGGKLTVAGLLLFGSHPEREIPSAQVRICRFRGTRREVGSQQNLADDLRCEGPIPHLLHQAAQRIREWQPTRRALTASGRFDDVGLVPDDAWLEGLVNAVVHRAYNIHGDHIHVNIYDDRIDIESPGRFPGLADPTRPLEITRYARNPRIARVCTDLRITQELGEGIRRMFLEMRKSGLADPLYRQTPASVILTLSGRPVERNLTERLPTMQQRILAALREANSLSTGEIVEAVGAARPTVLRHLRRLRTSGYVDWVGKSAKDPRASWQVPR